MKKSTRSVFYWTPRILGILFAIFISLFALDVFGEGRGFWETILALLMHLIPTFFILIALAVSWRWEWIGAVLFSCLGLWYIVMAWGEFDLLAYLFISGPLFLIGVLFLLNWILRTKAKPAANPDPMS